MTSATPEITVVVPVYNETANIRPLASRIAATLDGAGISWRLLYVDDGSRAETHAELRAAAAMDPRIGALLLSRNFGKEAALAAGLAHATGKAVVLMDGDLQHPPETIPAFVAKWREGFEMVYGIRSDREADSLIRRAFTRTFYALFRRLTTTRIPPEAGDFRLLDRKAVDALVGLGERTRFTKGLYAWIGFRQTGIAYDHPHREAGSSQWGFRKLWRLAIDGITAFSTIPLRVWSFVGLGISGLALLMALYFVIKTLIFGTDVPGYPSLIVSVMFFSGIQLLSLGVLGEYIGRIFEEAKGRPLFIVAERIGAADEGRDGVPR